MADDWFCHQHSEECSVSHKNLLQPREGWWVVLCVSWEFSG